MKFVFWAGIAIGLCLIFSKEIKEGLQKAGKALLKSYFHHKLDVA